jgi:hypothetical protein
MKRCSVVGANAFMVRQAHHEGSIKRANIKGRWYEPRAYALPSRAFFQAS